MINYKLEYDDNGRPHIDVEGHIVLTRGTDIKLEAVPIHSISIPDNSCAMDMKHVVDLVARSSGSHIFPPVLLYYTEHRHWLIAGRHRFFATVARGEKSILAIVCNKIEVVRSD